jgi:hypothetical protein
MINTNNKRIRAMANTNNKRTKVMVNKTKLVKQRTLSFFVKALSTSHQKVA